MVQDIRSRRTPWRETPLVESINLSKAAGCRVFLKLENLQPSGSFKSRGLGLHVQRSLAQSRNPDKVHFFTSSGGNAGLGCIFAANFVGRPSTVVVPTSTKPMMVSKVKAAGASRVIQHGAHWSEADAYMREIVMPECAASGEEPIYVSPFDHPNIWDGHASMIDELPRQFEEFGIDAPPDLIVCSVGGGGLFNGIVQGVQAQGATWRETTKVLAMETVGADALDKALEANKHIALPAITSIATSLGAVKVSERTFELAMAGRADGTICNAVLSDAEAAMGCWRLADDERVLVEPACGVSVATCYGGRLQKIMKRPIGAEEKVVIIVCGGSGVSIDLVEEWRKQYGDLNDSMVDNRLKDVPSQANVPSAK